MTEQVDLAGDDFSARPWDYPGTACPHSGLLHESRYHRLLAQTNRRLGQAWVHAEGAGDDRSPLNFVLLDANVAAIDSRHLVVAVGSNASPAVMRRKFASVGVKATIPFVTGQVTGIRVAHSAHVSKRGYIAAAPFLALGHVTSVVSALLDDEQLQALDDTEPNYERILVTTDTCQLELEGGERPTSFLLYRSKHGVLGPPDGDPLDLQDQRDLFSHLRRHVAGLDALVGGNDADVEVTMQRLAFDEDLRRQVKQVFQDAGWVHRSDLGGRSDTGFAMTYGRTPSTWTGQQLADDSYVCGPSKDDLDRGGEQCVTLHPADAERLDSPAHVSVTGIHAPPIAPIPARLTTSIEQQQGSAGVDQVLRNALGVELQEPVRLSAITVDTTPLADAVMSTPHFSMVRVQPADLATVEQNVGLLSPLAMDILGLQSGDVAVVQGSPDEDGNVPGLRLTMLTTPEETMQRRERLSGGGITSRFPSAKDTLGVFPDLPWLFLDSSARSQLGINGRRLSVVRVRASRRFQLVRELRELLLVLVLAFLGLASVIETGWLLFIVLAGVLVLALFVIRMRLKQRLETKR